MLSTTQPTEPQAKPRWLREYEEMRAKCIERYYKRLDEMPVCLIKLPSSPESYEWDIYSVFCGNIKGTMIITDHSPLIPYLEKANALTRTWIKELDHGGHANEHYAGTEMWVAPYDTVLQCTAEYNEDWKLRNSLTRKLSAV